MAIKGLTDRGASFPQIGVLRKGGPSVEKTNNQGKKYNSYGKDLEGFRFDTDDAAALAAFTAVYDDEPRRIDVYLPYEHTEDNFWTCKEEWSASALRHRCDGETCTRWLDKKTGKYHSDPIPCPGGCKEVGRLKVIIPALRRMVYVVAETHSIHDLINISEQLTALEMLRGSLRGIPMILSRSPREISTPRDNGQRARVTKWLMSIEAAPSWVELQLQAMKQQALPLALPEPIHALPAPAGTMETAAGHIMDMESGEVIGSVAAEAAPQPQVPNGNGAAIRATMLRRIVDMWATAAQLAPDKPIGQSHKDQVLAMSDADLLEYGKKTKARIEQLEAEHTNAVADAAAGSNADDELPDHPALFEVAPARQLHDGELAL